MVKTDWISLVGLIVIPVFLMLFVLFNGFEMLMAKNKDERRKWLKTLPKKLWITAILALLLAGAVLPYQGHIFLGLGLLLAGVALAWIRWWWPKLIKLLKIMIKAAQACDDQSHGKD
jgi:succinate dehydrogenase/fumarate reductase cytochrome b subunit